MNPRSRPCEPAHLEAALAARFSRALHARAADLPHDVAERLRAGREQALARRGAGLAARRASPSRAAWLLAALSGRVAHAGPGTSGWWARLGPLLPLAVLVAGLHWASEFNLLQQARATAEIDAVLLADELPPAAYADPGFAEYLRSSDP